MAAAAAVLGVERVLELGQRLRGVLDPEVGDPLAPPLLAVAAEVGDQRVVGVEDEPRAAGPARRPSSPTRRPGSRPRRSDRAGRGRGCRARSGSGRAEAATRGSQASSTSNSPSLAVLLEEGGRDAPGHVRAGPVVDRGAARVLEQGGDHPRRRRLAVGRADQGDAALEAAIPGARSRRGRGGAAPGPAASCRRRGRWPGWRRRSPAQAPAWLRKPPRCARWRSTQPSAWGRGTITPRARGRTRRCRRQVGQVLPVGVDGDRAARAQLQVRRPEHTDLVELDVGSLEHLRQVTHEPQLAALADHDDVEQAVVELGVRARRTCRRRRPCCWRPRPSTR